MNDIELRSEMLQFKTSPENIERVVIALVAGGAAPHITAAKPIKSEGYLGFKGDEGRRIAWLHVGHIDIDERFAPDNSFPSGNYPGDVRVAFPGYAESKSPESSTVNPLPCQQCFNAMPYCDCD